MQPSCGASPAVHGSLCMAESLSDLPCSSLMAPRLLCLHRILDLIQDIKGGPGYGKQFFVKQTVMTSCEFSRSSGNTLTVGSHPICSWVAQGNKARKWATTICSCIQYMRLTAVFGPRCDHTHEGESERSEAKYSRPITASCQYFQW